jgi:hypothetical protein
VSGQADGAHLRATGSAGLVTHSDADEPIGLRDNNIAASGQGWVAPAQEIQIVPGLIGEVSWCVQAFGIVFGTVDER